MNAAKELLEAIQNEADFENTEVEKAIIDVLEKLEKDLDYVQYEMSSDVEAAIVGMNKIIAAANNDIEAEDEDEDDEDDMDLLLDDEDDEDDDEVPLLIEEENGEEDEPKPIKE